MLRVSISCLLFWVGTFPALWGYEPQQPSRERAVEAGLPPDIAAVLQKQYTSPGAETRFLKSTFDLNGDGKPEILVHVLGLMACGTGGCSTMVFTSSGSGYALVSTIALTNPPIRVSKASSAGWRNLIVEVRGGGVRGRAVELLFDGKKYPENPSVNGVRVKTSTGDGEVLIREYASFTDATLLTAEPSKAAVGSGPSFNCARATTDAERLVCGDAQLSALDRSVADAYAKAMKQWPPEVQTAQRQAQRDWISGRDACSRSATPGRCVEESYKRRLLELQIKGGLIEAPTPVAYICKGQEREPFSVAFYNQTDPRSAVITMGNKQVIALAVPAASGTQYATEDKAVDFRNKGGEATVTWDKSTFDCKEAK